MCEWTQLDRQYGMKGFHNKIHSFSETTPGFCPNCAKALSYQDMNPPGRCTRSMCTDCYENIFVPATNQSTCMVCNYNDISHKIPMQKQNPRELRHKICDDDHCIATWARMHSSVLGIPPLIQQIPAPKTVRPLSLPFPHNQPVQQNVYQLPKIKFPAIPKTPQLPEPEPLMRFDSFQNRTYQDDDNLIVIDPRKRR